MSSKSAVSVYFYGVFPCSNRSIIFRGRRRMQTVFKAIRENRWDNSDRCGLHMCGLRNLCRRGGWIYRGKLSTGCRVCAILFVRGDGLDCGDNCACSVGGTVGPEGLGVSRHLSSGSWGRDCADLPVYQCNTAKQHLGYGCSRCGVHPACGGNGN